jgi:peptidoglycan/xylan/chitin deacetylase (PgdA/CDA1 family)/GT2 family glycosyltransferase
MSSNPQMSVVIATYNRREILLRSLATLFAQDLAPELYEVVVVVDGSTDGTAEALRALHPGCGWRVLERPHGGISPARNDGIRVARSPIILILDDDIFCAPDVLRLHLDAHRNSGPQIVFGPVLISPESLPTLTTDAYREIVDAWMASLAQGAPLRWPEHAALDPNASLPLSLFRDYGAFDESLPYQREDSEIGMRFWKRGVPFRFLPTAIAYHRVVKKTWEALSRDMASFGKNDLLLARKVPEYRPYSVPARIAEGPWWKRVLRRWAATLPFSPAPLFMALLAPFEFLRGVELVRRWGVTLFRVLSSALAIRSAAREAGSWSNLRREFGLRLPVLTYHHIGETPRGWVPGLSIPPAVFERQIAWLARHGYQSIRSADWRDWVRTGKPLPDKPILLTFDDAYADLARCALPVLKRYGFTGLVFVITGRMGQTVKWEEAAEFPSLALMTAEEIRSWAQQGIEFGAHSRNHPHLTNVSAQILQDEIAGSGKDLEELLQTPITSFAYPYGSIDKGAYEVSGKVYDLAFTTDEGVNTLGTDPHLLLRAMLLPADSRLTLWWRSHMGFDPVARLALHVRRVVIKTFFGSAEDVAEAVSNKL